MKYKLIITAFICSLTIISCSKEDIETNEVNTQAKSSSGDVEDYISLPT